MGEAIDTPSGDLKRDLAAHLRVAMWRPQLQVVDVRAMDDLGEGVLRFVLATEGVKRDGHSVSCSPEAWRLKTFLARPVALWSHGHGDPKNPPLPQIGEWMNIEFEQDGGSWRMVGDLMLSRSWDLPQILHRMYLPKDKGGDGFRGATSIGWTPFDAEPNGSGGYHMTDNELNEASLVAMGADQDALQIMQRAISTGTIPEKYVPHFAANRLMRAAEGKAYLLDFRDPIEVRSPEKKADPAPAEPEIRIIADSDDAVTFERVKGDVAFVLERQGKPDEKAAARQAKLCRDALAAKKVPDLERGWRAVPILPGRAMVLSRADGKTDDRARVLRELTESIEKGSTGVLPAGWTLRAMARSDRSDALDILLAQFWAFYWGARDPAERLWYVLSDVFYEDAGIYGAGSIPTEDRARREVNVIRAMLSGAMEVVDAIEQAVEPAPDVTGTAMTASFQRVGKKYAAATVKKLEAIAATVATMLEEAQAQVKAETETASGSSEFARLAADLDAASEQTPAKSESKNDPPAERSNPLDDLTRSLNEPMRATFDELADSLGAA